jgi:predicted HicB family RNase H-like nuclease
MAIKKENTIIQVIISKEIKEQIEDKAKKDNRSLSNYIAHLLEQNCLKPLK